MLSSVYYIDQPFIGRNHLCSQTFTTYLLYHIQLSALAVSCYIGTWIALHVIKIVLSLSGLDTIKCRNIIVPISHFFCFACDGVNLRLQPYSHLWKIRRYSLWSQNFDMWQVLPHQPSKVSMGAIILMHQDILPSVSKLNMICHFYWCDKSVHVEHLASLDRLNLLVIVRPMAYEKVYKTHDIKQTSVIHSRSATTGKSFI